MKIAFFTPTRRDCGIADYARQLLPFLRQHAEVEVIAAERAVSAADYPALGSAMNEADVAHIQYEHGFFLHDDAPAENFDQFMNAICVPRVLTLHCLPLQDPLWQRHLEDPGTTFVVHSREHRAALRARGARGEIDTAFLPAPPRTPASRSPSDFRVAEGLQHARILSIFGFTKAHKGYPIALEACRMLAPTTMLLIAGGPQDDRDRTELSSVLQRAAEMELASRVRVTGYLPEEDVGAVLGASDVVLAPFTSMTGSGSVATALSWERPVVASALPQHVELHERFGCLQLFEPGNPEDLARQVERVLGDADLRRELIAGTRRFRETCSPAALASLTHALYARVDLARSHAGRRG
jgi:glycosyltransferase involved in cell wall biosynthesis